MDIKNPSYEEVESAFVGETWHDEVAKRWRGARAIVLNEVRDQEKRTGFNAFQTIKLQRTTRSDEPKEDLQEVLDVMARSIHAKMFERTAEGAYAEDATVLFCVEIQRDKTKGDGLPARPRFFVAYNLSEEPDGMALTDTAQDTYMRQCEFMVEKAMGAFAIAMEHTRSANSQILEMAKIGLGPVEASGEALRMASEMQRDGYTAVLNGHAMQFAENKAKADADAKIQTAQMWSERLGSAVESFAPFLPGIIANISQRFGDKGGGAPPVAPGSSGAPPSSPVVAALHQFRDSLTAEQGQTINDALTEAEIKALGALLQADNTDDVLNAYQAFGETVDTDTLQELAGLLDAAQQLLLAGFMQAAARAHSVREAATTETPAD